MSAAFVLPLMTVDQFFELPEPAGMYTYELHFGELVRVSRPKKKHYDLQRRIRDILLRSLKGGHWVVDIEMPYGLSAEYDVRAADIGVVRRKIWGQIPDDAYLIGSPEFVIQVKSRSNRDKRMESDAVAHITHGAAAVILVKPDREEIVLITAKARTVYGRGDTIELPSPLSLKLSADEIL